VASSRKKLKISQNIISEQSIKIRQE